jgi:hypothetical protein
VILTREGGLSKEGLHKGGLKRVKRGLKATDMLF